MMVSRTSFCIYLGPHAEKKHFYVIEQLVFECLEPEKITFVSREYINEDWNPSNDVLLVEKEIVIQAGKCLEGIIAKEPSCF